VRDGVVSCGSLAKVSILKEVLDMKRKDALIIVAGVLLGLVIGGFIINNSNHDIQQIEEPQRGDMVQQREETIYLFGLACVHLGYSFASKGYSLEETIAQYDDVAKEAKE
jgi:hypothetical protein